MRDFDFLQPASVHEASRMLADLGEDCRVMAGGTALMLVMRQRMLNPSHVIAVDQIAAMQGIDWDDGEGLRIGALSRHAAALGYATAHALFTTTTAVDRDFLGVEEAARVEVLRALPADVAAGSDAAGSSSPAPPAAPGSAAFFRAHAVLSPYGFSPCV
jgi:xanthine dehydrogenase iron-sulfur cluster and FAD-binding subunit A